MTPGLRASSSLILKTIFIRSEPMSAIFVKMPPAMRRHEAPSDSPMANPRKQKPTIWRSTKSRMMTIITSSSEIRNKPIDMPARSGMLTTSHGTPRSEAKAVRVGVSVDPNAVPGDGVGAAHSDHGEEEHEQQRLQRLTLQAH